uniref:Rhomboid domain-containing protein n=2 Tax=Schistosoma TaxID=6181 RepID=A0A3Q0KRJ0_SCHMA
MAFLGGYTVSLIASVLEYAKAHELGLSLNSTGLQCIRYVVTGTAAAICHSSVSFISAKATGRSDSWVNHALGGAASGLICTWNRSMTIRATTCIGFAIISALGKYSVEFRLQHPDWHVPVVGEYNPSPYVSLNQRWMYKGARQQEEELEKHV